MNFMIAAVFAATPENFITRSDLAYITRLLHQIGLDIPAADVEEAVSHTFLFIERVHHLYQHLRTSPPHLPHTQMHDQKQNLAKLVIHRMAQKWDTEHKHVIKTLALKWLSLCQELEVQHQEIERLSKQLALFEERKTASATIFARTVQAEEQALHSWQQLKTVAEDIADLRRVTRMLEEENALNKLHQFPIESLWPEKFTTVETGIPSWQEMQTILKRTQNKQTTQASQTVITASPPLDHSPLYQKKLISRAKQKDLKALKEISAAKTERIAHLRKQMPGRSEHFK